MTEHPEEKNGHRVLGASGAHRWLRCAMAPYEEKDLPDTSGPAAEEGTIAHEYAARALINQTDALTVIFKQEHLHMIEPLQSYIDFVRSISGRLYVEQHLDYSELGVPQGGGTADAVVLQPEQIHVIDLKFGTGDIVYAQDNEQLLLYLAGALIRYGDYLDELKSLKGYIHQPRRDHIDEMEISVDELVDWMEHYVRGQAEAAWHAYKTGEGQHTPGEKQCKWCKARRALTCQAFIEYDRRLAMEGFGPINDGSEIPSEAGRLEWLAEALSRVPMMKLWAKTIEEAAQKRAEEGETIPGFKLVEGRSTREWSDSQAAENLLKRLLGAKNAYTKEVLSPAQAEKEKDKEGKKLKGDPRVEKLIHKKAGALKLVPEDDKRQPVDRLDGYESVEDS